MATTRRKHPIYGISDRPQRVYHVMALEPPPRMQSGKECKVSAIRLVLYLLIALVVVCCLPASSGGQQVQSSISGTILDVNGGAVTGAQVTLVGRNLGDLIGCRGKFQLSGGGPRNTDVPRCCHRARELLLP